MPSISPGIRFLCWLLLRQIKGTWLTSQGLIRPSRSLPPPTIASWSHPMATRLWRPSIWNWAAGWCAAMGWPRRSLEWSSSLQLGRKSYCTVDSRYILLPGYIWKYLDAGFKSCQSCFGISRPTFRHFSQWKFPFGLLHLVHPQWRFPTITEMMMKMAMMMMIWGGGGGGGGS